MLTPSIEICLDTGEKLPNNNSSGSKVQKSELQDKEPVKKKRNKKKLGGRDPKKIEKATQWKKQYAGADFTSLKAFGYADPNGLTTSADRLMYAHEQKEQDENQLSPENWDALQKWRRKSIAVSDHLLGQNNPNALKFLTNKPEELVEAKSNPTSSNSSPGSEKSNSTTVSSSSGVSGSLSTVSNESTNYSKSELFLKSKQPARFPFDSNDSGISNMSSLSNSQTSHSQFLYSSKSSQSSSFASCSYSTNGSKTTFSTTTSIDSQTTHRLYQPKNNNLDNLNNNNAYPRNILCRGVGILDEIKNKMGNLSNLTSENLCFTANMSMTGRSYFRAEEDEMMDEMYSKSATQPVLSQQPGSLSLSHALEPPSYSYSQQYHSSSSWSCQQMFTRKHNIASPPSSVHRENGQIKLVVGSLCNIKNDGQILETNFKVTRVITLLAGQDLIDVQNSYLCQKLTTLNSNNDSNDNLPDLQNKLSSNYDVKSHENFEVEEHQKVNPYHKIINIRDNQDANIKQYLLECCQFIHQNQTGSTFVHCHSGISRSTTVCIAYIMYINYLSGFTKFPDFNASRHYIEYVRNFRVISDPNLAFRGQLCRFLRDLKQEYYDKNPNIQIAVNPNTENCEMSSSSCNMDNNKIANTSPSTLVNSKNNSSNSSNLSTSRKRSLNEMNDQSNFMNDCDRLTPTNNSSIFIQEMSENANLHPPLYDTKVRCDTNMETDVKFSVGCDPAMDDFLTEDME